MRPVSFRVQFLAIFLTVVVVAPAATFAQAVQPAQAGPAGGNWQVDPLHVFSESIQALTAKVTKSVVQVVATGYGFSSEKQSSDTALFEPQEAIGAGVILAPDGYIVTNAHVVQGARKIRVRLPGLEEPGTDPSQPRSPMSAKVVGIDRQSDLAVLKIDATNLPALELADSNQLKQGQVVFAFGSPQGLENSVTMGVVSATARQVSDENPTTYIQTDAPINPGNSGGPLVDVDGRVVGIDTFILSESGGSEGLGFAIPSNVVRNIYQQLKTEGHVHRGQIGVYVRTITPDLADGLKLPRSHGLLLEDVTPGSSAAKAGLKVGEVITAVGGKAVGDVKEFATLLFDYKIGETAPISVVRDGKEVTVDVTVAERPDDPQRFADMVTGPGNVVARLGIVGITVSDEVRKMLPDLRIPSGVIVAARTPSSMLLGEGPEPGDVIHSVNTTPVKDIGGLKQALRGLHSGDPIVLQVERDGALSYLVMEYE
ncbi:MAG TPA: trypsin-like peptidase domain-containing protein [Candidatus Eisenbacteria bacterium]|nr:trypsin-like peptidase domain-containing protein [Candidatus Eisenbacteria bacterium]